MLSASEFTVGCIGQAAPLTLVLPRDTHEETILIAASSSEPTAFFLSGRNRFQWFRSSGNDYWSGLLIPNVRIEVDEMSLYSTNYVKLGSVIRRDTQLVAQAKASSIHAFNGQESIVLEDNLPTTFNDKEAGFLRWRIVLGDGQNKRNLHEVAIECS